MKNLINRFSVLIGFLAMTSQMLIAQEKIEALSYVDHSPVSIEIRDGMIFQVTRLQQLSEDSPGLYIAPGFMDNQVNGFAGVSFSFGDSDLTLEGIEKATKALWKQGITTYLPTLTTNSKEVLIKNFSLLAEAIESENLLGSIPGFHLEGPYINPEDGFRGAHPRRYVKLPNWEEFMEFYEASGENILQITVAPEMEGALDFISKCTRNGIIVAIGHHNASTEVVTMAIDRGAKIATHLGNGAANMINRHRNPFWSQLADDRLHISIICDGFHLLPEEIQVFYKVKGVNKTVITSDVTHYAALEPGTFTTQTGEVIELTQDGMLRYPAQNVLYGSASPITKGIGHIMKVTGCTLAEAIQMGSTNPAHLYNLYDRGAIEPGRRADLVLFSLEDGNINVKKTWVKGNLVFED